MKRKILASIFIIIMSMVFTSCNSIVDSLVDGHLDKSQLKTAIESSKTLLSSKTIGSDVGNVSQDSYDSYAASISNAESVYSNDNITKAQLSIAISELGLATTSFKNSAVGSDSVKYLYATDGTPDITSTILAWEWSTMENPCTSDSTYNPCLKASRGDWAINLKFSGVAAGTFSGFSKLEFKIRATNPKVKAIFDTLPATTNPAQGFSSDNIATEWIEYATTGTPLENDWYLLTIDLTTLDADKLAAAVNLTLSLDASGAGGTMYVTDVCLKK